MVKHTREHHCNTHDIDRCLSLTRLQPLQAHTCPLSDGGWPVTGARGSSSCNADTGNTYLQPSACVCRRVRAALTTAGQVYIRRVHMTANACIMS